MPWKNGGGQTRELLAWPDRTDWIVRVSVADINASGPFSVFAGVDRWFAVLSGGAIALATAGAPPQQLDASQTELHAFTGDAPTDCTALGAVTQDFNVMLRRARGHLNQSSLRQRAALETQCELAALFTVEPLTVTAGDNTLCRLPGMALACWHNPQRDALVLQAQTSVRGWWLEASAGA